MKRSLLFLSLLLSFISAQSQVVIFRETFDGIPGPTAGGAGTYSFPSGWFLRNVDNRTPDAQVAYVNQAWERREDFGLSVIDSVAFSTSYYSPAGASDDWMWTPLINIPANAVLNWKARSYDASYQDGYEVRIMTAAGGPPTGGTGVIGKQVTNSTVVFSTPAEQSSWAQRSVSLAAYAGQSIYVGFRNNSVDKFLLVIDNVEVLKMVNYDANLVSVTRPTDYSQIPLNQSPTLNFKGKIRNNGVNAISNVTLTATVFNSANTQVFTSTSTSLASLAPGAQADFTTVSGFSPSSADDYRVEYSTGMTQADDDISNNIRTSSFRISSTTYARDSGTVIGQLGIGANQLGYLGQQYVITNGSPKLTTVSIYLTSPLVNTKMGMAVFSFQNGKPNAILYNSPQITITNPAASFYNFAVVPGSGLTLATGDTIVVAAVEIDSTLTVGQTTDIFTSGTPWVKWPAIPGGNWQNVEFFGSSFAKPLMIRALFEPSCVTPPNLTISQGNQSLCNGAGTQAVQFSSSTPLTEFYWTNNNPSIGLAANGSGNIPSFIATNTGATDVVATITVTPMLGSICVGTPQTFTITVKSSGQPIAAPLSQTIASGSSITTIALTSNVSSASLNWTRDNTATVTGIAANGSGDISGVLTSLNTIPTIVTFSITSSNNGCTSAAVLATVTVDPRPTVNVISNQSLCNTGATAAINFTGSLAGTVYNWTNDNTSIGLAASGTGNIASFTGTNAGTTPAIATVTVTPVLVSGAPQIVPEILYYKFNGTGTSVPNLASAPPAGATSATILGGISQGGNGICGGTLISTGTTDYVNTGWTPAMTGSWTISFKTSNIAASALTGYVFGDPINATNSFRCFTNGVAGAGNWILRGPLTDVIIPGGATTGTHTTTFVYDAAAGNIKGYLDGVLVTTVTQTAITLSGTGALKLLGYATSNSLSAGSLLDEFGVFNRALTLTEVQLLSNGCNDQGNYTGTPRTFTITVNPTPTVNAAPLTQTVCPGVNISTIIPSGAVTGTAYNWTRNNTVTVTGMPASGTGNISGALINNTTAPVTVTFTITPTANGCDGATTTASVVVNPVATASPSTSAQSICSGTAISAISFTGIAGTTYNWTRDNTVSVIGIAASGSGNISGSLTNTTTAPQLVTFTITPVLNGCNGTPVTATITVNPVPTANATPGSQTVCSGAGITAIVFTGIPNTTYNWTRNNTANLTGIAANGAGNISGVLTNATATSQATIFTITPTANGCAGTAITASVTVNPMVTATANTASQSICSGTAISAISFTGLAGTTYNWTRDNATSVTGIPASGSGNISGSLTNPGSTPQLVTFTVIPVLNGCNGVPTTATVTVNNLPTVTIAASPTQTLVPGQNTTITATPNPAGGSFVWMKDGITIPGANGATLGPLTVSNPGAYKVEYTLNGCKSTSPEITISNQASDKMWVYPNPSNGVFDIRYFNQPGEPVTVMISNAFGRKVFEGMMATGSNSYSNIHVDLGLKAGGIYIVELFNRNGKKIGTKKIMIQ